MYLVSQAQKKKYRCENKSSFFHHRDAYQARCHEMIDPKIDVRAPFDELSNGVWHLIHSGNLDSETPNNRRFD